MKQLEIEFFWPLTEQLSLGLDYTNCVSKPTPWTMPCANGPSPSYYLIPTNTNTSASIVASNLTVDVGTTVFKLDEEPPLYRKALYKLMNIKWEKK
jgi:hypothetical protein